MDDRRHLGTALIAGVGLVGLASGCEGPSIYDWGDYEPSIHAFYQGAGEADLSAQRERLAREVDRTREAGRLVPPGKLAHLGSLCLLLGDRSAATTCFEQEKRLFPESGRFMDHLIESSR